MFTDSRERNCSSHLILDINNGDEAAPKQDTIVLVTDKTSASITGIYHPPERTYKNATDTFFEACLPRTVIRLQQGDIRPPWRRPAKASKSAAGVLTDDIIGACSDGTIYTFSILSEPARHLLRFLQNLIEEKERRDPANQDTPISPRSGAIADVLMNGTEGNQGEKIRAMDIDPRQKERGPGGPRHKHIDGDLLGRWLNECGDFEALLNEGTEQNILRLFGEFAKGLWGDDVASVEEGVGRAKEWMGEVFMPVL